MIFGRSLERSRLDRLVAAAKSGTSGSLVLRGEAGIGKTALLDYAAGIAGGVRVLRVVGIESEAEVPFAALQVLFARDAHRLEALPGAQAEALRAAFGTSTTPVERLAAGAATLALLSELAGDGPLLCLLDDVQWFDRSSVDALLFAVRRLHTDPIATVFAERDSDHPIPAGMDGITLSRLDPEQAARLVAASGNPPAPVAERILTESGGNPLAIVELTANAAETPRLPAPVAPLAAIGRMEDHFRRQIRGLSERTRSALLLAAADPGSLSAFTAAAEHLALHASDLEAAEHGRLVTVTADGVVFRHPLIRSAAYQDAAFAQRLAVHQALADTLVDPRDADRRAWHLAAATAGTDDTAATALEQAAERALGRGAPTEAARALERAAQLSGRHPVRGRRLVAAARAAYDAGLLDRATELSTAGAALTDDPGEVAEAGWVRAQIAYERHSPGQAARIALAAAGPILTTNPTRAVSVLTEAAWCARDAADVALLHRCAEQLRGIHHGPALMVEGLIGFTGLLCGDTASAVVPIRQLLLATRDGDTEVTVERLMGAFAGLLIGEDELAVSILEDIVAEVRGKGALGWLPYALEALALAQLPTGRFEDASANLAQAVTLAAELGQDLQVTVLTAISALLAALQGDSAALQRHAALVLGDQRHHRMATAQATWALALNDLMTANPLSALDRLDEVCGGSTGRDLTMRAIPDHVEAGVRVGDLDRARQWLPRLTEWSVHTKSPVAAALTLRCEALLHEGDEASERFEASLDVDGCGPYDRARTRLAFGEWLRRHRRPQAARTQLIQARDGFDKIAAPGWRARVQTELVALGDMPADTPEPGLARLTPQELQVARRAAAGLSNREIAAELFLSPRTVSHHLYKAYPKLGVQRRSMLAQLKL